MASLPYAAAASSTADRACRATWRKRPSPCRLLRPCIAAIRSSEPHISPATPGAAARAAALSTPSGVSHRATTCHRASGPSWLASSAFGSMTIRYAVWRSAARSASNSGVPTALTRIITRSGSTGFASSASRACCLAAGRTASSRSITTRSAAASALPYRSGRSAGQNSSAGRGSGGPPRPRSRWLIPGGLIPGPLIPAFIPPPAGSASAWSAPSWRPLRRAGWWRRAGR